MRLLPLLLTALILTVGCEIPVTPPDPEGSIVAIEGVDDGAVPNSVRRVYREDAARLALRRIHAELDSLQQTPEIPEADIRLFYNALVAVYTAPPLSFPQPVLFIHTLREPDLHLLDLDLDSTLEWTYAWRRGDRLTGRPEIDVHLERYDLYLVHYSVRPHHHTVTLGSEDLLNMKALGSLFSSVHGVSSSVLSPRIIHDNDIRATVEDHYVELVYSVGWGDCPDVCMYGHECVLRQLKVEFSPT